MLQSKAKKKNSALTSMHVCRFTFYTSNAQKIRKSCLSGECIPTCTHVYNVQIDLYYHRYYDIMQEKCGESNVHLMAFLVSFTLKFDERKGGTDMGEWDCISR